MCQIQYPLSVIFLFLQIFLHNCFPVTDTAKTNPIRSHVFAVVYQILKSVSMTLEERGLM